MKGILPWLALLIGGGVLILFLTRARGSASGTPGEWTETPDGGMIWTPPPTTSTGEISWGSGSVELPDEPGTYVYEWDNGYTLKDDDTDITPEYIPPDEQMKSLEPEPVKDLYADTSGLVMQPISAWYDIRRIEEELGWSREEYEARMAELRETPAGSEEITAEDYYARGDYESVAVATERVSFNDMVRQLGGEYQGGILVAPDDWPGSVTEFAQYARSQIG